MQKFIRCKSDGYILGYSPILAANPKCEVITEKEAFPERFMPKATKSRVAKAAKGAAPSLDGAALSVPDEDKAPKTTNPGLAADAGAGLAT